MKCVKGVAWVLAIMLAAMSCMPAALAANELQVKVTNKELSIQEGLSKDIRNIAVLVTDPQGEESRYAPTGTMMIASINSRNGDAYMTVLQPNLLVEMPLVGKQTLAQAYALGGENLVMKTLNELLGLNIRDFVCIDLRRFSQVVELVGGINMKLSAEEAAALNLPADEYVKMDLEQTLAFMRLPKDNPGQDRQYDVVIQALYQATRERNIIKLTGLLQKGLGSLDTNVGMFDMVGLGTKVIGGKNRKDMLLPAVENLVLASDAQPPLYTTDMEALKAAVHAFLYE